jgi:CSLREA domain-containing protein
MFRRSHISQVRTALVLVLTLFAAAAMAASAAAQTFAVTTTSDSDDGACSAALCSLRDAVIASNATAGPNTITLGAGDFKLMLAGSSTDGSKGSLPITSSVTIMGAGSTDTTIDAAAIDDRIFDVQDGADFAASGLTLTGGSALPASAGDPAYGGAVTESGTSGTLTFTDDVITGNVANSADGGYGGAIDLESSDETLDVTGTTLSHNTAGGTLGTQDLGYGGAIDSGSGTDTITLTDSTLSDNTAASYEDPDYGGAVYDETGGTLTLTDSTVSGNAAGGAQDGPSVAPPAGYGGAFYWGGPVMIAGSTVSGNSAGSGANAYGYGGAVFLLGTMTATNSTFTDNAAGGPDDDYGYGGAVESEGHSTPLSFTNTTLSDNTAGGSDSFGYGGAVDAGVTVTVLDSTLNGNHAGGSGSAGYGYGGAMSVPAATATDSTFADNTAGGTGTYGYGGGISAYPGPVDLTNSTVTGNSASFSGGDGEGGGIDAPLTALNSIVADNTVPGGTANANCDQAATSQGHNLENGTSCHFTAAGDLDAEPELAPLAENGGPTETEALEPGSPAIDAGTNSGCPAKDQRGVTRPQGAACDIGAYEYAPPTSSISGGTCSGAVTATVTPAAGGAAPIALDYTVNGGAVQQAATTGNPGTAALTLPDGNDQIAYWGVSRGGAQEATHHAASITVDHQPPTVTIVSDQGTSTYAQNAAASITVSASDALSPLTQNPSAANEPLATATSGTFTITKTAVDQCGNSATASFKYTVTAPTANSAPKSISAPAVTGTAAAGHKLSCTAGSWTGTPTSYTYQWNRDGTPIVGATGATYTVQTIDEGSTLTCTVSAANAAGAGPPVTSAAVRVKLPIIARCPAATESVTATALGPARLGATRTREHTVFKHSSSRGQRYEDFFCLTPIGIRVGYASPALLRNITPRLRRAQADRVVWISTSNPLYAVRGIRPGATLAAAAQHLHIGRVFPIGANDWYLAPYGAATAVLKTRHGVVEEIGIAERRYTVGRAAQSRFLRSFR